MVELNSRAVDEDTAARHDVADVAGASDLIDSLSSPHCQDNAIDGEKAYHQALEAPEDVEQLPAGHVCGQVGHADACTEVC